MVATGTTNSYCRGSSGREVWNQRVEADTGNDGHNDQERGTKTMPLLLNLSCCVPRLPPSRHTPPVEAAVPGLPNQ